MKRLILIERNFLADELLNVANVAALFVIAERNRNSLRPRACRSANAMNISFCDVRNFEVYDMRDVVDVDPARSKISRD